MVELPSVLRAAEARPIRSGLAARGRAHGEGEGLLVGTAAGDLQVNAEGADGVAFDAERHAGLGGDRWLLALGDMHERAGQADSGQGIELGFAGLVLDLDGKAVANRAIGQSDEERAAVAQDAELERAASGEGD